MKSRTVALAVLAVLIAVGGIGCEGIKTRRAEEQRRRDEGRMMAEREHLESFAADYAAWLRDWDNYMATLPEPPLPDDGTDRIAGAD